MNPVSLAIDPTGQLTEIGTRVTTTTTPTAISAEPSGNYIYVANGGVSQYKIIRSGSQAGQLVVNGSDVGSNATTIAVTP